MVQRILHLDDSPHRIAFGVFLGFLVGWTPTMGLQIVIYLVLAYALRANRASGLLPVFLTNPITAVPVYLLNWQIGRWILHPNGLSQETITEQQAAIREFVSDFQLSRLLDSSFWTSAGTAFRVFGLELIVGCLVVGFACGVGGYIVTYYGVVEYRKRRALKMDRIAQAIAEANREMAA
ncbi:MAG: DUF2062 domain-containing protein [Phycisphaerales bacterium]|nr:DUF2062 domain-containing protein [Phycisphaerales bacterium]MCB9854334.1 DUF2062 domain-containing protein [Phycisphaerales bacterium]MCB9863535.1 DUF2062 domain-containing protein [Phycisphaerales bacterium]